MILEQKSKQSAAASRRPRLSRLRRVSVALRSRRDPEDLLALVMLFGRRDEPTDAVRDYANCLSKALRRYGISCENSEISWHENGWLSALAKLWKHSRDWRGRRVVFHYTALMWSRRGFPLAVTLVLKILKLRGCRTVVVFHDVYAAAGPRWIDRFRVFLQERMMCHLSRKAYRAVLPVPPQKVPWLQEQKARTVFIPVGANISSLDELSREGFIPVHSGMPTVAVFGIPTWPSAQKREVEAIVQALRKASTQTGELQLLVLGRGAKEAESLLRAGLSGTRVSLRVDGLRSSREIGAALSCCDALLFVRGGFSSRRGSGVAAIACGLPIVAFQGCETGYPLTEAGVLFVPQDDADGLGKELARVLLDGELRLGLRQRNLKIFRETFSWERIAECWIKAVEINIEDFSECPEPREAS